MKTGLLHPYPGSKKDWQKYPIWDERPYDAVIEPFVGSGHFTHRMLANGRVKNAFVSDIDPAVSSVWECWQIPDWRNRVQNNVTEISESIKEEILKGKDSEIDAIFEFLKWEIERPFDCRKHGLACASILIRKLVFGGVLRCNAQGKLNVALSQDKLDKFPSFHFQWPHFDDENWRLSVSDSWQNCIKRFENSNCQNAIAFVDPPYWLPSKSRPGRRGTGAMTPAYTHHGNPEGQETLSLFIDCLDRLLDNPRVGRIVATNYVSSELCLEVDQLLKKRKRKWWFTPLGTLATMNNGSTRDDCPIEGFWEFGGRRMAGKYEQKSLLEITA